MKNNNVALAIQNIPQGLSDKLIQYYSEIQNGYNTLNWDKCGMAAGKFVEIARRIVEYKTSADDNYVPIGKKIPPFTEAVLRSFEQSSANESWRIIIPRVLYSVYCIRNKRGSAHETGIDSNKTDSLYIYQSAKWLLCEIARLCAGLDDIDKAKDLIDTISTRTISIVYEIEDRLRITNPGISCQNQVILLLYVKGILSPEKLQHSVEYSNKSRFYAILKKMHKDCLIDYDVSTQKCRLLENGIRQAEAIIGDIENGKRNPKK